MANMYLNESATVRKNILGCKSVAHGRCLTKKPDLEYLVIQSLTGPLLGRCVAWTLVPAVVERACACPRKPLPWDPIPFPPALLAVAKLWAGR